MARIVYQDDFKDRIINSTKKIIGIGALAFLMSGCQTTMDYQQADVEMTNQHQHQLSIMENAASQLPKVNNSNFEDIIENNKSGVYQHPVYSDQIVTYQFEKDTNSEIKIKNQLTKLGLSPEAYDKENNLYEWITTDSDKTSRHIQNPFGNKDEDINLCKIFPDNVGDDALNEDYQEELRRNGFDESFSPEQLSDMKKMDNYRKFHLLMHEAGHSLKHQQMKIYDYVTFNKEMYIMLENSAETFANIKTIQLMNERGESPEFMNKYMEGKINSANVVTNNRFGFQTGDVHQYVPTTNIVADLVKTDLDYILNLTDQQIDMFSEVLSKESVSFDYASIYNDEIKDKAASSSIKMLNSLQNTPKDKIDFLIEQLEIKLDDPKSKTKSDYDDLKIMKVILEVSSDNYEYLNEHKAINYVNEKVLEKIKDLEISSLDINERQIVGIEDYGSLHKVINKKLEEKGLPTPNDSFNAFQEIKMDSRTEVSNSTHTEMEKKSKLRI